MSKFSKEEIAGLIKKGALTETAVKFEDLPKTEVEGYIKQVGLRTIPSFTVESIEPVEADFSYNANAHFPQFTLTSSWDELLESDDLDSDDLNAVLTATSDDPVIAKVGGVEYKGQGKFAVRLLSSNEGTTQIHVAGGGKSCSMNITVSGSSFVYDDNPGGDDEGDDYWN